MNHSMEEHFVQAYIKKNRRERLLYELTNSRKRYDGLSRFYHQARELLNPALIRMEGSGLEQSPAFQEFVRQHNELCCLLSPDAALNERYALLSEGVELACACFDAVIIIGSSFSVVFGESMKGGREKYLLKRVIS